MNYWSLASGLRASLGRSLRGPSLRQLHPNPEHQAGSQRSPPPALPKPIWSQYRANLEPIGALAPPQLRDQPMGAGHSPPNVGPCAARSRESQSALGACGTYLSVQRQHGFLSGWLSGYRWQVSGLHGWVPRWLSLERVGARWPGPAKVLRAALARPGSAVEHTVECSVGSFHADVAAVQTPDGAGRMQRRFKGLVR